MNTQSIAVRATATLVAGLMLVPGFVNAAQPGGPAPEPTEQQLEAARQQLEQAAREFAGLSVGAGGGGMLRLQTRGAGRAALGINIGSPDESRREDGVPVLGVSPGGPAAEAGIRAGDILVSVDGNTLKWENDRSPRAALLAVMDKVEPGESVPVEYRRDGKLNKVNVVAQPLAPPVFAGQRVLPLPGGVPGEGPFVVGGAFFRGPQAFGAIELVSLTPKLGQYFGTDKGLLVVRAPADSRLGLEEGDVLLDIAGRVPTSPAHAMRILDSYQAGEKLALTVLRMKKQLTIDIEIPADSRRGDVLFETPARPALPVPGNGNVLFNVPVPPPAPPPAPGRDDRV
jgi:membrane-associated protease RseP (regulator of RpoE activity)